MLPLSPSIDTSLLYDALRFYLRCDGQLRRAGLGSLVNQPDWAAAALWAYAQCAAERLQRWHASAAADQYMEVDKQC